MADQPSRELVQFKWRVPQAGYRWLSGTGRQRRWLVENEPERRPAAYTAIELLREMPGLYLTFAGLGSSDAWTWPILDDPRRDRKTPRPRPGQIDRCAR